MNKLIITTLSFAMLCATCASAETISQTTTAAGNVSTTVQTQEGTTVINTVAGKSVTTKDSNGVQYELDSDNSVYQLFPDGARTAAMDGQHTLLNGQVITVKDGKRIP